MTNTIPQKDSSPSMATRKRLVAIVAGALVVILLGVLAAVFGPRLLGFQAPANEAKPSAPTENAEPRKLTEYRNDQVGIALSYPSSWAQLRSPDPQILLVASKGPLGTVQVRAVELPISVDEQQLPAAKQLTDQIVGANKTVKMLLEPQQIERGGLPGYWYFYTFTDETGKQGAHSHFFLFKGTTMLSLVFETLPAEKFKESAAEFDQTIDSLHVPQK